MDTPISEVEEVRYMQYRVEGGSATNRKGGPVGWPNGHHALLSSALVPGFAWGVCFSDIRMI